MRRFTIQLLWALALACAGSAACAQNAADLVGTWTLVSSVMEKDGKLTDQFGAGARGMMTLDPQGRFMLTIIGSDLPKFASNNRATGTAEENSAVVGRSIAMLGSYSLDLPAKTLVFDVESATFANWNGTRQKRSIVALTAGELKYVTAQASGGGTATVTWNRAK